MSRPTTITHAYLTKVSVICSERDLFVGVCPPGRASVRHCLDMSVEAAVTFPADGRHSATNPGGKSYATDAPYVPNGSFVLFHC